MSITRFLTSALRLIYHLLYHHFAWSYDWVAAAVSAGQWNNWVFSILPDLRGPNVLELGHGPGHLQIALHDAGVKAAGLDRSPQMGRMARRNLARHGLPANLVNADAQSLPFPDSHFHQVAATFPSDYIIDPKVLAEVYRVLIPGGQLLVVPVAWTAQFGLMRFAADAIFRALGQSRGLEDAYQGYIARMASPGFSVSLEERTVGSNTVVVIQAKKPASNSALW